MDEGQRYIQQFEQLGRPLVNRVRRMPWLDMFAANEGTRYVPNKFAAFGDCCCLSHLNDAAIDALVQAGRTLLPPYSTIVVYDLHNAATRIASSATAYPMRQPHLTILLGSFEESNRVSDRARAWTEQLSSALAPHSLSQCWPQLVQGTEEGRQRLQRTYRENMPRLMAVKRRVDPRNLFSSSVVPLQTNLFHPT